MISSVVALDSLVLYHPMNRSIAPVRLGVLIGKRPHFDVPGVYGSCDLASAAEYTG